MERKIGMPCVLYDRECVGCLECETCDLDPNKVCDNCGKCIEMDDVASIKIDKIYTIYRNDTSHGNYIAYIVAKESVSGKALRG